MDENDPLKIILLGETGVGKTNLINVTMGLNFNKNTAATLLPASNLKEYNYNNKKYIYNLWDTAGQEAYRAVNKIFIKDSKIILIVCAINDRRSFNEIHYWINNVKEILKEGEYIMALIGNKIDLYEEQEVTDKEIEDEAKKYKIKYLMTSALTQSSGFKKFLEELLLDYITTIENGGNNDKKVKLKRKKSVKKRRFC